MFCYRVVLLLSRAEHKGFDLGVAMFDVRVAGSTATIVGVRLTRCPRQGTLDAALVHCYMALQWLLDELEGAVLSSLNLPKESVPRVLIPLYCQRRVLALQWALAAGVCATDTKAPMCDMPGTDGGVSTA